MESVTEVMGCRACGVLAVSHGRRAVVLIDIPCFGRPVRAYWWAIGQPRREHASVSGLARQLGTTWRTVWAAIKPLLAAMADDPARFEGVTTLGVDEHIWHHVTVKERGPKELTGMVDLTRDKNGKTRARLLDLVPGRSGAADGDWFKERGDAFRARVKVATLDPFSRPNWVQERHG